MKNFAAARWAAWPRARRPLLLLPRLSRLYYRLLAAWRQLAEMLPNARLYAARARLHLAAELRQARLANRYYTPRCGRLHSWRLSFRHLRSRRLLCGRLRLGVCA